jgi:hypothetical protein
MHLNKIGNLNFMLYIHYAMRLWYLYILLLSTTLTTSCNKDKLTKETQEGKNTLSCKVNGKVFIAEHDRPSSGPAMFANLVLDQNGINATVYGINTVTYPNREINIIIEDFKGVGTYVTSGSDSYCEYSEFPQAQYSTMISGSGTIHITKDDRSAKILSGTFEFVAGNKNNSGTQVEITLGRFDISY